MATTAPTPAAPLPCNRKEVFEELLLALERLSAELVEGTDPSVQDAVAHEEMLERLKIRGRLIEQLAPHSEGLTMTYVEWNRLVVIHRQGARIEANLRRSRKQLMTQASVSERNRAFLECVSGVFTPTQTSQNILA